MTIRTRPGSFHSCGFNYGFAEDWEVVLPRPTVPLLNSCPAALLVPLAVGRMPHEAVSSPLPIMVDCLLSRLGAIANL